MLTMADDLLLLNPSEEELKELNFDNLDYDLLDREDDEVPGSSTNNNQPPSDAANPSSSSMPNLANRTVVIGSEASKKKSAEMKKISRMSSGVLGSDPKFPSSTSKAGHKFERIQTYGEYKKNLAKKRNTVHEVGISSGSQKPPLFTKNFRIPLKTEPKSGNSQQSPPPHNANGQFRWSKKSRVWSPVKKQSDSKPVTAHQSVNQPSFDSPKKFAAVGNAGSPQSSNASLQSFTFGSPTPSFNMSQFQVPPPSTPTYNPGALGPLRVVVNNNSSSSPPSSSGSQEFEDASVEQLEALRRAQEAKLREDGAKMRRMEEAIMRKKMAEEIKRKEKEREAKLLQELQRKAALEAQVQYDTVSFSAPPPSLPKPQPQKPSQGVMANEFMMELMKQQMEMMQQMASVTAASDEGEKRRRKVEERRRMEEIQSSLRSMEAKIMRNQMMGFEMKFMQTQMKNLHPGGAAARTPVARRLGISSRLGPGYKRSFEDAGGDNGKMLDNHFFIDKVGNMQKRFKHENYNEDAGTMIKNEDAWGQSLPADLVLTDLTEDGPKPHHKRQRITWTKD